MKAPDQDGEPGAKKEGADQPVKKPNPPQARPAWWTFAVLLGLSLLILVGYSIAAKSIAALFLLWMVATASLVTGILLGFLFGLPRIVVATRRDAEKKGDQEGRIEPGYDPSNSLEQLADWLTKILVGIGLVQFGDARRLLAEFGRFIGTSLGRADADLVGQLIVIVFVVLGLLASFLWTRIHYPSIQAGADTDVWSIIRKLDRHESAIRDNQSSIKDVAKVTGAIASGELKTRSEEPEAAAAPAATDAEGDRGLVTASRAAGKALSTAAIIAALPKELREKVQTFREWDEKDWNSDPGETLFGKLPSEDMGRRITARIEAELPNGLTIRVGVESTPRGEPLTEPVLLLFHPTFRTGLMAVYQPVDNAVSDLIFSRGYFTLVAITDGGRTVLSCSLRELRGAPPWFKNT